MLIQVELTSQTQRSMIMM